MIFTIKVREDLGNKILLSLFYMYIPQTGRNKALFIVDVQKEFIINRNKYIIPYIVELIQKGDYDTILYSISYNKEWSLWYKQIGWFENPKETDTIPEILQALQTHKNVYKVMKLSKSIFKCDENIHKILQKHQIEEIHICWYESNDCVFVTAEESFDLWFFTFVIEEATETRTTAINHTYAIALLKYLNLTNNSNYVGKNNIAKHKKLL